MIFLLKIQIVHQLINFFEFECLHVICGGDAQREVRYSRQLLVSASLDQNFAISSSTMLLGLHKVIIFYVALELPKLVRT